MNHHDDPTPEPRPVIDWREVMAEHDARPDGWAIVPAAPLTEAPTAGETHAVGTVAPDVHDGVRHAMRADGTVARYGTAYVHADDPRLLFNPAAPLAHLVSAVREVWAEHVEQNYQTRHGARGGTRALDLARMADLILTGTETPRMIGTDVHAWSEVLTVPVGAFVEDLESLDAVRWANPADPWAAAMHWFGLAHRPATPGAIGCRFMKVVRPTVARGTSRRSVAIGRARTGDVTDRVIEPTDGPAARGAFGVLALVAPSTVGRVATVRTVVVERDDNGKVIGRRSVVVTPGRVLPPSHRWQGHVLIERPSVHRSARSARRTATRLARTVTTTVDGLASIADGMAPGTRVRFTTGTVTGTVARSDRGAWSVRATRDGKPTVSRSSLRQARYVRNVVANLSR